VRRFRGPPDAWHSRAARHRRGSGDRQIVAWPQGGAAANSHSKRRLETLDWPSSNVVASIGRGRTACPGTQAHRARSGLWQAQTLKPSFLT
jgi:hypothetical protein